MRGLMKDKIERLNQGRSGGGGGGGGIEPR